MKKLFLVICISVLTAFVSVSSAANGWLNILKEGGNNKGVLCTEAIQKAIDKAEKNGGGTIYFPAGHYLTGALRLKNNITLHLDAGSVLKFSTNFDHYLPFVQLRWEGTVMKSFSPLLYAKDVENVTITGRGTIDGQGEAWWKEIWRIESSKEKLELTKYQKMTQEANADLETAPYYARTRSYLFHRPPLFQAFNCKNVRIEGVTIQNSPFWTINPAFCDNVTIDGVTIFNPYSPNTDGINPTSCKNVHISNCHISVGDDCITIKSGRDADGRKWATPTENVTITNCTMLSGHGGVVIGSEMSGGIKKITIANCVFDGTDRGIRLKAARGRGGVVEEIRVSNIVMNNIKQEAFMLNLFYDKNTVEEPVSERTPIFRNIHISNVTGTNVNTAGRVIGIPEMPVHNLSFSNINMDAKEGFSIHTATDVEFHDVKVNTTLGASFKIENVKNIILDNVSTQTPIKDTPIIKLDNVSNAMINNNFPMYKTQVFLEANGTETQAIYLKNNVFENVETVLKKGNDLKYPINIE
ncbi:Polygalacturonase [Mariniflexile rhizosphaerae]|uniref:glycoside hydrolase family 28 protein n=1 Tax=unclassified Mariniflexile TaxID=2643887 RepID=UPI000CB94A44|nr:glycoside hydrolase family 28 protein [Mariniflexile sp. TRM1-10]AXP80047.1 Polygalacturonase [Mariniflexile sp. TRM1-10]PLB20947.1 MAG: Endopolygalacturonase [Flavobacteriaceae bacterium FS1-H7996/R]